MYFYDLFITFLNKFKRKQLINNHTYFSIETINDCIYIIYNVVLTMSLVNYVALAIL